MADDMQTVANRATNDLRSLGKALNDAGFPASAIRLYGMAGFLRDLEDEISDAQRHLISDACRKTEDGHHKSAAMRIGQFATNSYIPRRHGSNRRVQGS